MGKRKDLTDTEKAKIVKYLSEGCSTCKIAQILNRDHRTIKKFVANSQSGRKKRVEPKRRKLTERDLRKISREVARNPLASSASIFQRCDLTNVPKTTRWKVLRDCAQVKKAKSRPPLNANHMIKRLEWAKNYMKCDFSKVLWTDEMRITLDGPDGWARGWVAHGSDPPIRLRRQQGGGGVMVWAAIIDDTLIGPFRVQDGVKINSQSYCQFLQDTYFKQWFNKKSAALKKSIIFMQDNAPSHASHFTAEFLAKKGIKDHRLMVWPPASPDLNPIENVWSILKREVYRDGQQYTSKNSLWEAIVAAAGNIEGETIRKLTSSVDTRLMKVIEKKGNYIEH